MPRARLAVSSLARTSSGNTDAFLRKYDSNGTEVWTRQFGSSSSDSAADAVLDGLGNVYLAGSTDGALPGQASAGSFDAFVRKYDSNGFEVWTRQFGTASGDFASAVAVDGLGNTYVAGSTSGTFPGQTSSGSQDAFVRKYDANGNEVWTRQFGSSSFESVLATTVDGSGNIYLTGQTGGAFPGQNLLRRRC